MRHVALLRGINVGGKNMLPMRELTALFEAAGATRIVTYIQSGNVVFDAPARAAAKIAADMPGRIEKTRKLKVPVVLRSADEMAGASIASPFLAEGLDEDAMHVLFLGEAPTKEAAARLDHSRSPPDRFALLGRDIHLFCPNGVARTKLTNAYFDSRLETVSTGRNLRTVRKLAELSAG